MLGQARRTASPTSHQLQIPERQGVAGSIASDSKRFMAIDVVKGAACLLIVAHHLTVYGPMSDAAGALAPQVFGWLYDYGRWAVQVFLVIGGYLAAASLTPNFLQSQQLRHPPPGKSYFGATATALIRRRYCRLIVPYAVAVAASVLIAAIVRPWFPHPSVPDIPSLAQALAHAALLQDILGFKALSAGIWYIAIDFQLYALSVLIFCTAATASRRLPGRSVPRGDCAMLAIGVASLWVFNRHPALDTTAFYFVGAYVLGMAAYWAAPQPLHNTTAIEKLVCRSWLGGLIAIGCIALLIQFRGRVALAWGVALVLVALRHGLWKMAGDAECAPRPFLWKTSGRAVVRWLAALGAMSYSVFLIHFPICMLVNAVMARLWPADAGANLLGLAAAMALSLGAGRVLYRCIELAPGKRHRRGFPSAV